MSIETAAVWLLEKAWVVILGIFVWYNRKQESRLDNLEKNQKDLISHSEAKELVVSIVEPLRSQQAEMKSDLKAVLLTVNQIQTSLAVQAAVYEAQHKKDNKYD